MDKDYEQLLIKVSTLPYNEFEQKHITNILIYLHMKTESNDYINNTSTQISKEQS